MTHILHALNVPSELKLVSKKSVLIEQLNLASLPKSYYTNTSKEETVLEYVEDFRRQFVQVFPDRRPLLLCPKNETGVRKFVCSTIRPTKLPFNSIYDIDKAANFVADLIQYLPLDNSTQLPEILPSPQTTLKLQAGDCLDLSSLLCSILRGAGYNAYVVCGYAPKWVTDQNLADQDCPLLGETFNQADEIKKPVEDSDDEIPEDLDEDKEEGVEGEGTGEQPEGEPEGGDLEPAVEAIRVRYADKKQPKHQSRFENMLAKEKAAKAEEDRIAAVKKSLFVSDTVRDPLHGSRVHCWVMVLKGRRDVQEDLFVEPSTGAVWKVSEAPYLGIESVWNEKNYWANVQESKLNEINTDLADNKCWEYVLIDENLVDSNGNGDDLAQQFDVGGGEDDADKQLSPEEAFDDKDILDCPSSWCPPIKIFRGMYKEQFPTGMKTINYKKCTVEKYCEGFPNMKGMVLRITIFQTNDCVSPIEIREVFTKRRDKLLQRYTYPLNGRTHEYFGPGRPSGLKEYIRIDDQYRYFTFFSSSRTDGMVRRDEFIRNKIVEEYENRDDYLIYRSVKVDSKVKPRATAAKNTLLALAGCQEAPILKITEKFDRNPNTPAHEDCRKRTHLVADKIIRINYHYDARKITAPSLELDKTDKSESYPYEPENNRNKKGGSKPNENKDLRNKMFQKEKELISKVSEREGRIGDLLITLTKEAEDVQLEKSIYDKVVDDADDNETEKDSGSSDEKNHNKVDYLSPFLAQYKVGDKNELTRKQALQAKEECLAALKERLLERANIIQRHLDEENQNLHQRRTMFKRQNGSGASAADEEFTKYYEMAAFRIDILKTRLARHEETALKKFVEMEQKLNNDPRLRALRDTSRHN